MAKCGKNCGFFNNSIFVSQGSILLVHTVFSQHYKSYKFYSRSSSTTRANGFLRSNQSSASPPPILNGSRFGNTSGIIGNNQERDQSLLRSHLNSVHDKSNLTSLNASTNTNHANTAIANTTKKVLNASALVPANVSKFMLLSKEAGVRVTITSLGQFPI